MNTELQTNTPQETTRAGRASRKGSVYLFLAVWVVLVAAGIVGTKWYTDQTRQQLTVELERQTASQIAQMQQHYEERITSVEAAFSDEMAALASKVDALNELLTFTRDNTNDKTDNSNKLYTQINEVKKKLNELQKSLDVLK